MTDWMEKANAQKDDYLKDLTTLVKIQIGRAHV